MDAPHYLERRIERELASRKAAERLLEAKSLELFLKNEELQFSSAKLQAQFDLIGVIMDAVPDVVITCNDKFRIETVNSSCTEVLGYSQADFVGTLLTDFMPALTDHRRALEQNAFMVSDITVRKSDGEYLAAELRGRRTKLYDKPLIVIVLHDISERKESERMKEEIHKQLHESRRLEAIGALSSGIAHELNTPIQFIGDNIKFVSGSLKKIHGSYKLYDQLKCEAEENGLALQTVDQINAFNKDIDLLFLVTEIFTAMQETIEGINQVADIVRLMKEFAHPGTGDPEPSDVNLVVKGALTICRNRTKDVVAIETRLTPDPPQIPCRRGQIQQVLINLIINAVEAIEEKGMKGGRIQIVTAMTETHFRIEINDNGPGIPATLKQKVFDPFFTTKQVGKGTGQGLALAKDIIVQQHGGHLFLHDRPGFSTCFIIELPINQPKNNVPREVTKNAQT